MMAIAAALYLAAALGTLVLLWRCPHRTVRDDAKLAVVVALWPIAAALGWLTYRSRSR